MLTVRAGSAAPARIQKILVPVDYSENSSASLRHASDLARTLHAELDVVHVWDRPTYVADSVMVHEKDGEKRSLAAMIRENAELEMRRFLSRFQERKDEETRHFPTHRLLSGEPASTLIAELERGAHDLVVVGTRGRTGLKHLLLGSVAEKARPVVAGSSPHRRGARVSLRSSPSRHPGLGPAPLGSKARQRASPSWSNPP